MKYPKLDIVWYVSKHVIFWPLVTLNKSVDPGELSSPPVVFAENCSPCAGIGALIIILAWPPPEGCVSSSQPRNKRPMQRNNSIFFILKTS